MAFDFFDEKTEKDREVSVRMEDVLREVLQSFALNMRVCMPAQVVSYNKDKQSVDVQPVFLRKYRDQTTAKMPKIHSVPVVFQRANQAIIAMPLKVGDYVTLFFTDRSIDKFMTSGGVHDPESTRNHDLSDAIAVPGLWPFGESEPLNNDDDIIIKNRNGEQRLEIRCKKNGQIQILNKEEELIKVLDDMLTVVRQAVVYTSTGAQKLRHKKFAETQKRLRTFLKR